MWFLVAFMLCTVPLHAAGTFRFLTTTVPDGTTNGGYFAALIAANAAGAVTYSVAPGSIDPLPTGLSLDPGSGAISGYPTVVQTNNVTFQASDGATTITLNVDKFKISAAGGGGNSGAAFVITALPDGRVGVVYTTTTLSSIGGVGPFIYGAQNLPTGITMNGTTGVIYGNPIVAGTFYVTLTLNDLGEGNKIITTLPLIVYPADTVEPVDYFFKFDTEHINNGEVGTAYISTLVTSGQTGVVTFSATGLPGGLALDVTSGTISGTPTVSGTFYIYVAATDAGTGDTISTNLVMWLAPNSTSQFYWDFFGIPAALFGVQYDRQPPITVAANNGTAVTYSAVGLPPGISYNTGTGELTGIATEIGVFPTIFTATDTGPSPDEVLTLRYDFIVLPPAGGDVGRLAVNLWAQKLQAKVIANTANSGPNDSWKASYIYNQNRTTGNIFNPAVDSFYLKLGNSEITLPPGTIVQSASGTFSYSSPNGAVPKVAIKGAPSKQTLSVAVSGVELGSTLPAEMIENTLILGNKGYALKLFLDAQGKFVPAGDYRNAALVVTKGTLTAVGAPKASLKFAMALGDPSFQMVQGDALRLRLYDGITPLLDKDLTRLVTVTETTDPNGNPVYTLKKTKAADPATTNTLKTFAFASGKGVMNVALSGLTLSALLPAGQAHLHVELVVGSNSYFTGITLFETKAGSGSYTTAITSAFSPF
jgi:hypothetical protein